MAATHTEQVSLTSHLPTGEDDLVAMVLLLLMLMMLSLLNLSFFSSRLSHLRFSQIVQGITNKQVLLGLVNGGILALPKRMVDARRYVWSGVSWSSWYCSPSLQILTCLSLFLRLSVPSSPFRPTTKKGGEIAVGLVPYHPVIGTDARAYLNYHESVFRLKGIKVSPTNLESTSLVMANGLDLFFTHVNPSRKFDALNDDFNHPALLVTLVALVVGSYVLAKMFAQKRLQEMWK